MYRIGYILLGTRFSPGVPREVLPTSYQRFVLLFQLTHCGIHPPFGWATEADTKRSDAYPQEAKALEAPRYAENRGAAHNPCYQCVQRQNPTHSNGPDNISNTMTAACQTTPTPMTCHCRNGPSKGQQHELGNVKALHSRRNSYQRTAQENSNDDPCQT